MSRIKFLLVEMSILDINNWIATSMFIFDINNYIFTSDNVNFWYHECDCY